MGWKSWIIWLLCAAACEGESPMRGTVQSPGFPAPYAPNLLQRWNLSAPEGHRLQLTFTHLDLEASAGCAYDAVTVLAGEKVLGMFCGQENAAAGHHPGERSILSPGARLSLLFHTDETDQQQQQHIGFSAHYQAIDINECLQPDDADADADDDWNPPCAQICHNTLGSYLCSCHHGYELRPDQRNCALSCGGGTFDEPEGHLSSPGYPDPSPHGLSCQYFISVEPGFTITLSFAGDFHVDMGDSQQGSNCSSHWLQLTIPEREPTKLCGASSPGVIATYSNRVTLDFHTDWAGVSGGWSLDYSTQRERCPLPNAVANGRVTPAFAEYFYRDYIHVLCDQGYMLTMDGLEINSYSSMCQRNGRWHRPLPKCQIVRCAEPEPLRNGDVTFVSGSENQYLSVIQYRCHEPFYALLGGVNVVYKCAADRKWRDSYDIPVVPTCIPVCGVPQERGTGFQKLMGGSTAPDNSIPWQVMLSVAGRRAGGMVVAERWVMTAAHNLVHDGNIVDKEVVRVYAGNNNVKALTALPPAPAASLHVHDSYSNPNKVDFNNDIALIRLQHPLTFNASIMPICLPPEGVQYLTQEVGLVSGFGVTVEDGIQKITDRLRFTSLPVVEQEVCRNSVNVLRRIFRKAIPIVTDNMFCAGVPEAGDDTCQGDSGSAFALKRNGRYLAAGIVSWGVDCAHPGRYGMYTRVGNYLSWINKTMEENNI